jgi:hypothetical protein
MICGGGAYITGGMYTGAGAVITGGVYAGVANFVRHSKLLLSMLIGAKRTSCTTKKRETTQ